MPLPLQTAWCEGNSLIKKADKLCAEACSLSEKANKRTMEAEKLFAEAHNLRAEAYQLRAEATTFWTNAIFEKYGNIASRKRRRLSST